MRLTSGSSARLGASWDGRGTNFALFSANAEKVELCLFDSQGRRELERIELPERSEDVWHGYLNDVSPGQLYGYRVYGPYAPEHGHRFNANKLLLDPYAKRLAGRLVWSDAHFGYRAGSAREDLSFDRRDNARGMPKAVVVDETFNWGRREMRPNIPWQDTIIYEAHIKGLTQKRDDVPPNLRGTYGGLSSPAMIGHLKRLGVTTVELLPVHGLIDDRVLVEKKLVNYWGYNTLAFFAPEARYAQDNALDAFRTTVARLHDAGIEVMLDVVYNHTAEGNHLGPTLSFRGIDNASYYWLKPDNPRFYGRFHRLRQLGQPEPSARAADGDGFAAVLGRGLPCRRLSFRPRHHASARAERLRPQRGVPDRRTAGSGAGDGEDGRRTLGSRHGRLPGRRVSVAMVGMERPLSQRDAPLLERRRQPDR